MPYLQLKYGTNAASGDNMLQKSFRILGYLSLAQLAGSLLVQLYQSYSSRNKVSQELLNDNEG